MRSKKKKILVHSDGSEPENRHLEDLELGKAVRKDLRKMTDRELSDLIASIDTDTREYKAGDYDHDHSFKKEWLFAGETSENKADQLVDTIPKVSRTFCQLSVYINHCTLAFVDKQMIARQQMNSLSILH